MLSFSTTVMQLLTTPSPSYVFNLLTSKIYVKEELHAKEKLCPMLNYQTCLAALCIDSQQLKY
jgi:hypothetical protein